jgi:transmembrane sensor
LDKGTLLLLLKKFRQGTCTPAEKQLLYKWLDALEQDGYPSLSANEMQAIKQDMLTSILPVAKKRFPYVKVAAIALPLMIAGYFALQHTNKKGLVAWRTVSNTDSQLLKITLPDHSVALLARHSTIQFPEHFFGGNRSVKLLEGKAFFEAVTDPTHPFTVEDAAHVRTTVLGTSFSVEFSKELGLSRVVVAIGKVKVRNTVLLPAQRLTVKGDLIMQDSVSTHDMMAWTRGEIVLRNATLQELLLTIKDQYGISATTSLDVHQGNYTIRFPATMALPEVLDIIQKISYKPKIHFTMSKDQLSIY